MFSHSEPVNPFCSNSSGMNHGAWIPPVHVSVGLMLRGKSGKGSIEDSDGKSLPGFVVRKQGKVTAVSMVDLPVGDKGPWINLC